MARKILLADDSVTAQNMGRKILADAGYEVFAVNNGSAALKKIAELKPDLVILDVYMPGYSGLEVCQRLKESHETARIPVLLTVGKLEPFKPEEAQRVRAEGYIVKPFEASELLSALSKLEDKVVPRAEPSKPGRFARAIAAVDDADRSGRNQPSSSETGWKSRIAFPPKKTEMEPAAETTVDVAAFAPIGVPKDVTPSEVSAITAAAAQMQVATRDEHTAPETAPSPSTKEFSVNPEIDRDRDSRMDSIQAEIPEAANVAKVSSDVAASAASHARNGDETVGRVEEAGEAPVTMAAASEAVADGGSSRWTAVPVALGSDETSMSLDREMQKAYAAFAAADYATSAGAVEAESTSLENSSAQFETAASQPTQSETQIETSTAAISDSQPTSTPEPQPLPAEATSAQATIEALPALGVAQPSEKSEEKIEEEKIEEKKAEPVAEDVSAVVGIKAAEPVPDAPVVREAEAFVPQREAEATSTVVPIAKDSEPKPESEPKLDSETVKTTAAAWASWRQIRDTKSNEEQQPPQPQQSETPDSDTAALAVAAGAEQISQQADAPPSDNPADVASIVDSVLADLRPKLMEEISRKMAEKK